MSQLGDRIFFSHITNMYIAPGWGQMSPWGPIFFSESLILSLAAHFLQDINFKRHFKSFPYSNALVMCVDLAVKKVKVITGS